MCAFDWIRVERRAGKEMQNCKKIKLIEKDTKLKTRS